MSIQIDTAFVQQYKDNVIHLSQQKGSRLRMAVREQMVKGNAYYFERIGKVAAVRRTSRHSDTPLQNTPHSRRRVTMNDYEYADLVDDQDKIRILISPESEYAIAASNAMGRAMDDEIVAAFNGNSYSGVDGTTVAALPAAQKIAASATGLTLAKLLSAKEILDTADVDPDEPRYIAVTPAKITDLLNTTEIKSADYNTVKALAQGAIDTFLGFKFIMSNRLALDGSGKPLVMAWAQMGLGMAIGQDVESRITERADKSYSVQVYYRMTIGCTRIEDEKCVQISVA